MTEPTCGHPLVQPDDVVSRIDSLIPADEVYSHPLVWRARNIDLALLIDARNEIKRLRAGGCARNQGLTQHCAEAAAAHAEIERLRARVEVLELIRRYMGQGVVSWDRAEEKAIDEIDERKARAALEVKP
jgi:hypothetical protein